MYIHACTVCIYCNSSQNEVLYFTLHRIMWYYVYIYIIYIITCNFAHSNQIVGWRWLLAWRYGARPALGCEVATGLWCCGMPCTTDPTPCDFPWKWRMEPVGFSRRQSFFGVKHGETLRFLANCLNRPVAEAEPLTTMKTAASSAKIFLELSYLIRFWMNKST